MAERDDSENADMSRPEALNSREALLDPYPWYDAKREMEILPYDKDRDRYMAFRYDVVKQVLEDGQAFTAEEKSISPNNSVIDPIDNWFVNQDPPTHTRLRRSVEPYFRPDYLEENFGHRIEVLATELLNSTIENEGTEFDYVQDYAIRIPTAIIADIIGVPREMWAKFREWSQGIVAPDPEYIGGISPHDRLTKLTEWITYFQELLGARRENPRDDLISDLLGYNDRNGNPLTDSEIISVLTLLNIAGNVTTTSLLSNAMRSMAEAGLIDDAISGNLDIEGAIEETLRYRSSLQETDRITTQETEIQGRVVPSDTIVELYIGAANRDPRQFDKPHVFNPQRYPNHLAFGRGTHYCLGAPLARLEAKVSLETFFDRFSEINIHLEHAEPQLTLIEFGLESLPTSVSE